jgi:ubiquinol-cytochrome c reductase cytochrome b subunit
VFAGLFHVYRYALSEAKRPPPPPPMPEVEAEPAQAEVKAEAPKELPPEAKAETS